MVVNGNCHVGDATHTHSREVQWGEMWVHCWGQGRLPGGSDSLFILLHLFCDSPLCTMHGPRHWEQSFKDRIDAYSLEAYCVCVRSGEREEERDGVWERENKTNKQDNLRKHWML